MARYAEGTTQCFGMMMVFAVMQKGKNMRLIDADALIEFIVEEAQDLRTLSTKTVGQAISKTPTVDAVPVIRCKDCKHKNEYGYCTVYLNFHHLTADMDYCSDAERKEE